MAQVRFVSFDGEEFTVPDRVSGSDGPEIEIVVCKTGEFIDAASETLSFIERPAEPEIVRLEVVQGGHAPQEDLGQGATEVWHATEDELRMAREEAATLRERKGKSLAEVLREIWG